MARKKTRRRVSAAASSARREQALSRPRGENGRFLTKAEIAAMAGENPIAVHPTVEETVDQPQAEHSSSPVQAPPVPAESFGIDAASQNAIEKRLEELSHAPGRETSGKSLLEKSLDRHERRLYLR